MLEKTKGELNNHKGVPEINPKSKDILMGKCKAIDGQNYLKTNVQERLHMQAKQSELAKFIKKPVDNRNENR